jgi:hypothetical protein
VHGADEQQTGILARGDRRPCRVDTDRQRQHTDRQPWIGGQQGAAVVLGHREDAIELPADPPLDAADGAPVEPRAQAGAGTTGQPQAVAGRLGQLVDGDGDLGNGQRRVDAEAGLQVFDVEEVEATGPDQPIGGAPQPHVRRRDAGHRQRAAGSLELVEVQTGQTRPPRLRLGPLGRLDPAYQGDPVSLGRPRNPLGKGAAARVRRVELRQERADPENVHPRDRGPHLL